VFGAAPALVCHGQALAPSRLDLLRRGWPAGADDPADGAERERNTPTSRMAFKPLLLARRSIGTQHVRIVRACANMGDRELGKVLGQRLGLSTFGEVVGSEIRSAGRGGQRLRGWWRQKLREWTPVEAKESVVKVGLL